MVRAPCCEKMGLKKGPWTPEEDQILISYIQQHGHANWRALPKQAGLSRCGKSCRLRWTNYLRPDIKRGNFTPEEEETIINLHEMLGNRWSAIAARLPGRTDNEIKNVWHTYLKKKLKNYQSKSVTAPIPDTVSQKNGLNPNSDSTFHSNFNSTSKLEGGGSIENILVSPQDSSSKLSSITDLTRTETNNVVVVKDEQMDVSEAFSEIDESFWFEDLSSTYSSVAQSNFRPITHQLQFDFPLSPITTTGMGGGNENGFNLDDGMDFWYNLFIKAGGIPELPEI